MASFEERKAEAHMQLLNNFSSEFVMPSQSMFSPAIHPNAQSGQYTAPPWPMPMADNGPSTIWRIKPRVPCDEIAAPILHDGSPNF